MIEPSVAAAPQKRTTLVQKFGGSSLATPDLRLLATQRVADAIGNGRLPVVVVSAPGRAPAPYATDTLLRLVGRDADCAERDFVIACGEIISAGIFAATLKRHGIVARALTGAQAGILTDEGHGDANILHVDPARILRLLDEGVVPVIAGFQGATSQGDITTIGRGGSDLTAVALAAALGNIDVEIYTDVEGVLTADPRRVRGGRTVPSLTHDELAELAHAGAKVMHAKAADLARQTGTPIRVLGLHSRVGSRVANAAPSTRRGPVTSVAAAPGFTFVHLSPPTHCGAGTAWHRGIVRSIADASISLECVTVSPTGVAFAVQESVVGALRRAISHYDGQVRYHDGCTKIVLVGSGVRDRPGVVHRAMHALAEEGVHAIHVSDSAIGVLLIVSDADAIRGETLLHHEFGLADS